MSTVLVPSASYILSDHLLSSEGTHCYDFFKHMAKYGYQFHAISNYVRINRPLPNVRFYQVGVSEERADSAKRYLTHAVFLARGSSRALQILRREHIDMIHHILPAVYNQTFSPLALLQATRRRPFIFGPVSAHVTAIYKRPFGEVLLEPLTTKLHERTVRGCQCLIAITNQVKELYKNLLKQEEVRVIPFGVDTEKFKPMREDGLSDVKEILYVGSLYPIKGLEYLVQATALVAKRWKDVRLRIVGSGPEENRLRSLVDELKIRGKVIFEGFVQHEDIVHYYQHCNIFAYTTLGEPFGKSIVESMACGKPVITSNIGGPSEIIESGKTGFLVPPTEPEAIAEKILLLLEDSARMRQMGEAARTAAESYSWEKVAELYHKLYKTFL
jgi:glycosyltransferase involved in cell wall biosynthesis